MTRKLIELETVGQTLQLSLTTLLRWTKENKLSSVLNDHGLQCCYEDEVDKLLHEGAPDSEIAFTWATIAAAGITFVTQSQAKTQMQIGESEVGRLGQMGLLRRVNFGRTVRYTKESVAAIAKSEERLKRIHAHNMAARAIQQDDLLTYQETAHVLGVGVKQAIPDLVANKRLSNVYVSKKAFITKESLIALLRSLLPAWIDPTTWLIDRLASTNALVHQTALCVVNTDRLMIPDAMFRGEVQYIRHAISGLPLLSQESYLAYIESNEPYTTKAMFARLFGTRISTITRWDDTYPGWRACRFHPHTNDRTYRSCALTILERYLLNNGSAWAWYEGRITHSIPAIDTQTAAKFMGLREDKLQAMASKHGTTGLMTPAGKPRFSASAIIKLARICWAARSD